MPSSLQLEEFSDRELLALLRDLADKDGWVTSQEIAAAVGLDRDHPARNVGVRFGWLRRYGVLEHDAGRWRLTPAGLAVIGRSLNARERARLETFDETTLVELTSYLTSGWRSSNRAAANLVRREWIWGTSPRRNGR